MKLSQPIIAFISFVVTQLFVSTLYLIVKFDFTKAGDIKSLAIDAVIWISTFLVVFTILEKIMGRRKE